MFDIGFSELLVICSLGLIVLGPERLPRLVRTGFVWFRKARSSLDDARFQIERELNISEIKDNLLNYNDTFKDIGETVKNSADIDRINEKVSKSFSESQHTTQAEPKKATVKRVVSSKKTTTRLSTTQKATNKKNVAKKSKATTVRSKPTVSVKPKTRSLATKKTKSRTSSAKQ